MSRARVGIGVERGNGHPTPGLCFERKGSFETDRYSYTWSLTGRRGRCATGRKEEREAVFLDAGGGGTGTGPAGVNGSGSGTGCREGVQGAGACLSTALGRKPASSAFLLGEAHARLTRQ